ncbi:hypothetical protein POW88_19550 [Enterobacter quasiroggenkampii]|nr:hypothetical protein [Enterobacter roggenkampii]
MSTPAHLWLEDENGSPELHYEAISWKYTEGNIIYRDIWNDHCCA